MNNLKLVFSSLIFLTSCAELQVVSRGSNTLQKKDSYEVKIPNTQWKSFAPDYVSTESRGITVSDIEMVQCSDPIKNIRIMRAVFNPSSKSPTTCSFDDGSFEAAAAAYLKSFYDNLKTPPSKLEFLSCKSVDIKGSQGIEIITKTIESYPSSCEYKNQASKTLLNKFLIFKQKNQRDFRSWQYNFPRVMALWYGTTEEAFDEGLEDFNSVVDSFQFL